MFTPEVLLRISKEVGAPVARVESTIKLFEDGATVPFIARYRKEATGNLDKVKILEIECARPSIAEGLAGTPEFRKQLRDVIVDEGVVRARVVQCKETDKTKYVMYYAFEETLAKSLSHRMLSIRRGTREGILGLSV